MDSFHFDRLYDGLHAESHIKNKLFQLLMKARARKNQLNKSKGNKKVAKSSTTVTRRSSCVDSDSEKVTEEDRCWKRQKQAKVYFELSSSTYCGFRIPNKYKK